MGALRTRMMEEMKLRNFSPRTQESYLGAMIGLAKHYRPSPDHPRRDSRLSVAFGKARLVPQFAQCGDLGDEVLLPPDVGLE
jgi:hypothetical protein